MSAETSSSAKAYRILREANPDLPDPARVLGCTIHLQPGKQAVAVVEIDVDMPADLALNAWAAQVSDDSTPEVPRQGSDAT